jgi:hypothetical protein
MKLHTKVEVLGRAGTIVHEDGWIEDIPDPEQALALYDSMFQRYWRRRGWDVAYDGPSGVRRFAAKYWDDVTLHTYQTIVVLEETDASTR